MIGFLFIDFISLILNPLYILKNKSDIFLTCTYSNRSCEKTIVNNAVTLVRDTQPQNLFVLAEDINLKQNKKCHYASIKVPKFNQGAFSVFYTSISVAFHMDKWVHTLVNTLLKGLATQTICVSKMKFLLVLMFS